MPGVDAKIFEPFFTVRGLNPIDEADPVAHNGIPPRRTVKCRRPTTARFDERSGPPGVAPEALSCDGLSCGWTRPGHSLTDAVNRVEHVVEEKRIRRRHRGRQPTRGWTLANRDSGPAPLRHPRASRRTRRAHSPGGSTQRNPSQSRSPKSGLRPSLDAPCPGCSPSGRAVGHRKTHQAGALVI